MSISAKDLTKIEEKIRKRIVEVNDAFLKCLGLSSKGKPGEKVEREELDPIEKEDFARKKKDKEDENKLKGSGVAESPHNMPNESLLTGFMDEHKGCRDMLISYAGRTALLESAIAITYSYTKLINDELEGK